MIYSKIKNKAKNIFKKVIVTTIVLNITMSCFFNIINAAMIDGIDTTFPKEYKQRLKTLRNAHPNWTFTAKHTNLKWNDVITAQMANGKSLTDQKGSWWRRDDIEVEKGWVHASKEAIEYAMNPLEYLNEEQIFQFETLNYREGIQTKSGIDGILYATEMSVKNQDNSYGTLPIKYYDKDGNIKEDLINKTYSQVIFDAGKNIGVNPYHLAARIRLETRADIKNNLSINGRYHPDFNKDCIGDYRGLYNYYNISANGKNPVAKGLTYAKTPGSYGEPWDNPEKAIIGGAMFIMDRYISKGQNTLYFQKFNVVNTVNLYGNQYMTNILAAKTEASFIYQTNKESNNNTLNMPRNFIIPVYIGLPGTTTLEDFIPDNTRVYLDDPSDSGVPDKFTIRSEPKISNPWGENVIHSITFKDEEKQIKDNGVEITRIERGINFQWDKIRIKYLDDGCIVEGYVFQDFVKDLNYPKISQITLDKNDLALYIGQNHKLNTTINPTNAWYKDVTWSSNDEKVAVVDTNGTVTAKSPGTATITVQTKETNKTAECIINVQERSIELDKTEYTLLKNKTLTLNPVINNTNSEYTISIEDPKIAKVSGNVITGIGVGTTNIKVMLNGTDKKIQAKLTVFEIDENHNFEIDTNILNINGNDITKINPQTKVSDMKGHIRYSTNLLLIFKDSNNSILKDTDNIGTGTKIEVTDGSGNTIYTYNIIIYGDIDGNGVIQAIDILRLQRYLLKMTTLTDIQIKAGNIDKSGAKPVALDLLKIQRHLLKIKLIDQ